MDKKKVINNLIIANLIIFLLYMLGKFSIIHEFLEVILLVIVAPIIFGVFLFYILKPLNDIFVKKGMKTSKAALLTLSITAFILAAVIRYFGEYLVVQLVQLKSLILTYIDRNQIAEFTNEVMNDDSIQSSISSLCSGIMNYISLLVTNAKDIFDKGMMLFSNVLLVILITFFLLRDGHNFKNTVLKYCPGKYKDTVEKLLPKCDDVLSTYIIGQAIVALSLATMVFIGYVIIGMPSALLLAFTTFILAFIPFVGFFISMIIPYIVATIIGFNMLIKLTLLFIIAQTLKGRVVVPFIMGKTMNIHPITDIFLVVGGAAIGGPLVAFCIVPIYSLLKLIIKSFIESKDVKIPFIDKIKKV